MSCSIGRKLNESCSEPVDFKKREQFSARERKIIRLRTGLTRSDKVNTLCQQHVAKYFTRYSSRQRNCSGPLTKHASVVREISYSEYKLYRRYCPSKPILVPGEKLCGFCKIEINSQIKREQKNQEELKKAFKESGKIYKEIEDSSTESESESSQPGTSGNNTEEQFDTPPGVARERLSSAFQLYHQSPLDPKRMKDDPAYVSEKVKKFASAVGSTFQKASLPSLANPLVPPELGYYNEMMTQMKERFSSSDSSAVKFQILSCLPASFTIRQMEEDFGASNYMARAVKLKVAKDGILCSPNPRLGKPLSKETEALVLSIYNDDKYSRVMPGYKDNRIVRLSSGEKVRKQKRLLLNNLRELYREFLNNYNEVQVSFSKFAEIKPVYCILPGASGTHTVCVCTIHQNLDLMLKGSGLNQGYEDIPPLKTMKDCFKLVLCDPAQENCYFGQCKKCPGTAALEQHLQLFFHLQMVEQVIFKQWTAVDRAAIETIVRSTDHFIDALLNQFPDLCEHFFVASQQTTYLSERKKKVDFDEVFVVGDFSMNSHPTVQDSSQSYHWNTDQITIHLFVCYFKESEESDNVEHKSFVCISDWLKHDTAAVYAFQKRLVNFLKSTIGTPRLKKIVYSSDGARSQYKNQKNVLNLCFHEKDFGLKAEWHFSATAHGKGPSDAVPGLLKRMAYLKSLKSPVHGHILTAEDLYNFVLSDLKSMTPALVTTEEVKNTIHELEPRFKMCKPLHGISSLHSIIPVSEKAVLVRSTSSSPNVTRYQLYPEKP